MKKQKSLSSLSASRLRMRAVRNPMRNHPLSSAKALWRALPFFHDTSVSYYAFHHFQAHSHHCIGLPNHINCSYIFDIQLTMAPFCPEKVSGCFKKQNKTHTHTHTRARAHRFWRLVMWAATWHSYAWPISWQTHSSKLSSSACQPNTHADTQASSTSSYSQFLSFYQFKSQSQKNTHT